MSKSQNNNIFVWIGLCILLILPSIARTQSVELAIFAFEDNHSSRPEHPEVDSALIMTFFADSMVIWYFRLSQYDTIYIIRNHFTENVTITHHEGDEKTIVFVSREMAPPAFVSGRRLNLVLEVLGFSWEGRNKVRLSIGRDTENQATIRAVKKRGCWHVYGGGIS